MPIAQLIFITRLQIYSDRWQSILINELCRSKVTRYLDAYTHTHTHTHTYIYIYIWQIPYTNKANKIHYTATTKVFYNIWHSKIIFQMTLVMLISLSPAYKGILFSYEYNQYPLSKRKPRKLNIYVLLPNQTFRDIMDIHALVTLIRQWLGTLQTFTPK